MKRTTYAMPPACRHCGNMDITKFMGDWTGVDCKLCGGRTPYVVEKVEEIDVAPSAKG